MTDARESLLQYISDPTTVSRLHAYVRRRGLSDSADDVVQTVLCDALAVQAVPSEVAELPRFLTGIARNKVADEYRRRSRWKSSELPDLSDTPQHEASDLLRRIDSELHEPEERETLASLMREHAGDSLYEIARERALAPDTLRQRICRLRKRLRARYLLPIALAVGLGVGVAQVIQPSDLVGVGEPAPLAAYSGDWRVTRVEPSRYASMHLRVRIEGRTVRVYSGTEALGRELLIERVNEHEVVLSSGSSRWVAKFERLSSRRIELRGPRGFVVIER
ncbi:MAG: RNA polymerase sigma factor [Myxococcota bacterium]